MRASAPGNRHEHGLRAGKRACSGCFWRGAFLRLLGARDALLLLRAAALRASGTPPHTPGKGLEAPASRTLSATPVGRNRPAFTEEAWTTHFIMCRSFFDEVGGMDGAPPDGLSGRHAGRQAAASEGILPSGRHGAAVRHRPRRRGHCRRLGATEGVSRLSVAIQTFTMQRRCVSGGGRATPTGALVDLG